MAARRCHRTGLGKWQHAPITIVKEGGSASPMFLQAMNRNEVLPSVVLEFVRPASAGTQEVYKTLTLENAMVTSVRKLSAASERRAMNSVQ